MRIRRSSFWDARIAAADKAIEIWRGRQNTSERVVVAAQFGKNAQRLEREISDRGVPVKFCKREDLVTATDAITVTTFHQLKGLEFDHVVITGLEDETMPQFWINKQHSEKPEETEQYMRRLVYVAMTRAKKKVVLAGGEPFSRFFSGIPDDLFQEA